MHYSKESIIFSTGFFIGAVFAYSGFLTFFTGAITGGLIIHECINAKSEFHIKNLIKIFNENISDTQK